MANASNTQDTRMSASRSLRDVERGRYRSIISFMVCVLVGIFILGMPGIIGVDPFSGLSWHGRAALSILVVAALLWITEAIPAYAVGLLVIGLNILLLSGMETPAGNILSWETFAGSWSNRLMWLFIGGFFLAEAMSKTELDLFFAKYILARLGTKPIAILLGTMGITFVLSMFMSNTATTAMMITLVAAFVRQLPEDEPFGKAVFLGVPVAANVGGMGTIIGTPPNGIAQANLASPLDFLSWMVYGVPIALILLGFGVVLIYTMYRPKIKECKLEIKLSGADDLTPEELKEKKMQRYIVGAIFMLTVFLWMFGSYISKGLNAYVVSFVPIVLLAVTGVMKNKNVRNLPWEVLMMLAGGISLGIAIKETGLADWLANSISGLSLVYLFIAFSALAVIMSNLMSNTATASILIPVAASMTSGPMGEMLVIVIALCTSCAMILPISTPPNALAFATGKFKVIDFIKIGVPMAIVGPVFIYFWVMFVFNYI